MIVATFTPLYIVIHLLCYSPSMSGKAKQRDTKSLLVAIFISPEHTVLMVSYRDRSMSVVRRQQLL